MLAAGVLLQRHGRPVLAAVFGPACDGELTTDEVLDRVARLAAAGGLVGVEGITPEVADELERAVRRDPDRGERPGRPLRARGGRDRTDPRRPSARPALANRCPHVLRGPVQSGRERRAPRGRRGRCGRPRASERPAPRPRRTHRARLRAHDGRGIIRRCPGSRRRRRASPPATSRRRRTTRKPSSTPSSSTAHGSATSTRGFRRTSRSFSTTHGRSSPSRGRTFRSRGGSPHRRRGATWPAGSRTGRSTCCRRSACVPPRAVPTHSRRSCSRRCASTRCWSRGATTRSCLPRSAPGRSPGCCGRRGFSRASPSSSRARFRCCGRRSRSGCARGSCGSRPHGATRRSSRACSSTCSPASTASRPACSSPVSR